MLIIIIPMDVQQFQLLFIISQLIHYRLLPGTLTGRDLAERLQQDNPRLKVIFMTGYGAGIGGDQASLVNHVGRRFLQKPCPSQTILETVRQCLDDHTNPETG